MPEEFSDILLPIIIENVPDWERKVIKDLGFEVLKKHFSSDKKNYEIFFSTIENDLKKMDIYDNVIRFYYFWCKRPSLYQVLPPDFKLIVIFSIMESLASDDNFLSLSDWLKLEMKSQPFQITNIGDLCTLLDEYYKIYGSRRKVRSFLKDFCEEESLNIFLKALKKWDELKNDFVEVDDIDDFFNFLDGVRNLFIHDATDIQIKAHQEFTKRAEGFNHFSYETATVVKGKSYLIDNSSLHIDNILGVFEKGVIKYFSKV